MREILFRGKNCFGEWVEGFYYQAKIYRNDSKLCDYITIPHPKEKGVPSDHHVVDPATVSEFTGLTDKNGKKIFEGDICQTKGFPLIDEKPFIIEWNTDECSFYWRDAEGTDEFTIGVSQCTTVIGNIHDNPELLKGE